MKMGDFELSERKSDTSFILGIVAGALNIIIGAGIVIWVMFDFWQITSSNGELNKLLLISYLCIGLYFLIIAVWIFSASYLIKDIANIEKGATTLLILGILSINILAIIAGIIVIIKIRKSGPNFKSI